ncbi:MAG: spondin domain-containing protein [Gemmatimonadaceae bacterium]|nr:spondin domain-containing protein [Gemmatimonadaceae bacterium]MBA3560638.1 spondin domain-containing protein [Gemmatimonadaceae bacterium]
MNRTVSLLAAAFALAACSEAPTSQRVLAPPTSQRVVAPEAAAFDKGGDGSENAASAASHTYEVTIENMTQGQPFSPGVIVTHTKKASVWEVGARPSPLIINIAEDGLADPALTAAQVADLRAQPGVFQVVETGAPIGRRGPLLAGQPALPTSRTFTIEAAANANRLSVAVMIICTNDGFTGLSEVKLPGGFKAESHLVGAYDAGSEQNTEKFSDIVDPCHEIGPVVAPPDGNNNALPEDGGLIRMHGNIQGGADLVAGVGPTKHGWSFPVAKITVQRMK